jgi:hypothetical protein|tara:strand:+ start:217 stop:378 length:162 start_codon:yes stop_codon:yes gene_type:complete
MKLSIASPSGNDGPRWCTDLAPVGRYSSLEWVRWINKQLLVLNSWKKLMRASF